MSWNQIVRYICEESNKNILVPTYATLDNIRRRDPQLILEFMKDNKMEFCGDMYIFIGNINKKYKLHIGDKARINNNGIKANQTEETINEFLLI